MLRKRGEGKDDEEDGVDLIEIVAGADDDEDEDYVDGGTAGHLVHHR